MAERMLVTQALDERDLLRKKIEDKTRKARFVDIVKPNESNVFESRVTREEFAKQVEGSYQQIIDLIDRYQKIDAAIIESNAHTKIQTSYGEYTIAAAISLRLRLRQKGVYDGEAAFEVALQKKMELDLKTMIAQAEVKNKQLQGTAENMRLSILGKDGKMKDEKPLEVVEAYVRENTTEIVDPIDAAKKIAALMEKRDRLLTELETQIKVSNATTFIEI